MGLETELAKTVIDVPPLAADAPLLPQVPATPPEHIAHARGHHQIDRDRHEHDDRVLQPEVQRVVRQVPIPLVLLDAHEREVEAPDAPQVALDVDGHRVRHIVEAARLLGGRRPLPEPLVLERVAQAVVATSHVKDARDVEELGVGASGAGEDFHLLAGDH